MPDGGLVNLRNGQSGIFKITDLTPSAVFFISIDPTSIEHVIQGTPSFTIDSFTYDPNNGPGTPLTPDPDNSKTIYIGATLHIAPNTTSTPGAYHGTYDFMINF